jgi:hypothetical protein
MAVGFPTKANWSAGDVLTASALDDLAGTVNLVSAPLYNAAGKNKIINGDMGVWQRGTTFTPTNATYTADRWGVTFGGSGTLTCSQQTFTPGTAPVAGYEGTYFLRMSVATVSTISALAFYQGIEDVRVFAGQTVTFSLWAKADSARTITLGFGQGFGSGGSSFVSSIGNTAVNVTTSWARYSVQIAIPSVAGKTIGTSSALYTYIYTGQASGLAVDVWGVQVEAGSYATGFQTATGTVQGELAACQRYYWRANAGSSYQAFASGIATSTSTAAYFLQNPVPMRTVPSSTIDYSTLASVTATGGGGGTFSSITANWMGAFGSWIIGSGSGALVLGNATLLIAAGSTSAYIGLSAEL